MPIRSVEEFHRGDRVASLYSLDKLPSKVRQETLSVDEPGVSLRENYIVRVFQLNELYRVSGRVDFSATFHTVSPQKEVIHGRIGTPWCPGGTECFCVERRGSMAVIMDGPRRGRGPAVAAQWHALTGLITVISA